MHDAIHTRRALLRRGAQGAGPAIVLWILLSMVAASVFAAQSQAKISLELNRIRQVPTGCEALLVLQNSTGIGFEQLQLDLVLFDRDGIVMKRIAVEAAPLKAGKTVVRQFVIQKIKCADLARMLLNGFTQCKRADGEAAGCAISAATSSRTKVEFFE